METTANLRPAGMNDEQTECDACGRMELRGTVVVVDEDGNEVGRYGTTCASRVLGVKWTRTQVNTVEMGRRQAVVNTIQQARKSLAQGDAAAAAWWLRELRFYSIHRADEVAAVAALREAVA